MRLWIISPSDEGLMTSSLRREDGMAVDSKARWEGIEAGRRGDARIEVAGSVALPFAVKRRVEGGIVVHLELEVDAKPAGAGGAVVEELLQAVLQVGDLL